MTWWERNSNTVLTIFELVGFVGTTVSTARATSKIIRKKEWLEFTKEDKERTKKERAGWLIKSIFPEAIIPLIFGTGTFASIVGTRYQYVSQQTAIASGSVCAVGKRLYNEHKEKLNEVMNDICPIDLEKSSSFDFVEESRNGKPEKRNDIFVLGYTGRRFKSNLKDVEDALKLSSEEFFDMGNLLWNELYLMLGISETPLGSYMGFADSERMDNPDLPENDRGPLFWDIKKVSCGECINATDAKKMQDNNKHVYVIIFDNVPDDIAWYRDLEAWDRANEMFMSL